MGFGGRSPKESNDDEEEEEEEGDECPRTWGSASEEKIACTSPPCTCHEAVTVIVF